MQKKLLSQETSITDNFDFRFVEEAHIWNKLNYINIMVFIY